MTDPDIKNLRRIIARARKRRERQQIADLMSYYASVQFKGFTSVRVEQPNPREPIGRLARFIERWAKK